MKQIIRNFAFTLLACVLSLIFISFCFGQEQKKTDAIDSAFDICLASANTPKPDVGFELSRAIKPYPHFSDVFSTSIVYQPELVYPPAARAAKAAGTVNIDTVIDEDGNVIWAKVIKGHPLLRAAALRTLCHTRFKTIVDENGIGLKFNGWMVYIFAIDK